MSALNDRGYDGILIMGAILNQDGGDDLPVDVTNDLIALGIHCPGTTQRRRTPDCVQTGALDVYDSTDS